MTDEGQRVVQQLLSQHGGPAFVRRGREVQLAFEAEVEACREKREEFLTFVRLSLGTLFALAGSTPTLESILESPEELKTLENLKTELQPRLRVPPAPTTNIKHLHQALAEVRDAIERFNQRWGDFLARRDLRPINEIRDRYNRYYLLERECALGSTRLARQGFEKLDPLTSEDFLKIMPLLLLPAP